MKWYQTYYFLIPAIILIGFLNYNPHLLFKPTGYQHLGWQCAILASICFMGIGRIRGKSKWKELLGINFKIKDLYIFLGFTIFLTYFSYWIIYYVLKSNKYQFQVLLIDYKQLDNFKDTPFYLILSFYIYYIPQAFNEEMIVGALLLNSLKSKFKVNNELILSAIVASVFCLMHFALYKFRPIQPRELLSLIALLSLFMVGLIRNLLILRTGKITYSWVIHLSWNLLFFNSIMLQSNGKNVSEPGRFNLILGDWRVMLLLSIITFLVIFWSRLMKIKQLNLTLSSN